MEHWKTNRDAKGGTYNLVTPCVNSGYHLQGFSFTVDLNLSYSTHLFKGTDLKKVMRINDHISLAKEVIHNCFLPVKASFISLNNGVQLMLKPKHFLWFPQVSLTDSPNLWCRVWMLLMNVAGLQQLCKVPLDSLCILPCKNMGGNISVG